LSLYWDHYLLLVGAIVILTVIFAPKGIVGLYNDLYARLTEKRDAAELQAEAEPAGAEKRGAAE